VAETPRVSAVVLAWQAEPFLRRGVEALLASEKVEVDVVLVDNGCTTDDVEVLERIPRVTVVRPGRNLGFAGGCNAGAAAATGEFLALVNGDAIVEPNTLARLVDEAARPGVGAVGGSLRLAEDPALLNSAGNPVHILGLSWVGRFRERETGTEPVDVTVATGACMVLRRDLWNALGGFDAEYFAYHEDAELSIRVWRRGLRVVYVPDAVAVHRYEFSRNAFKFYLIERNRLMFLATLWSGRALLLLVPALAGLELAMLLLATKQRWLKQKLRGYGWLLRNGGHLRRRRRLLRAERRVADRVWMARLTDTMDNTVMRVPGVGVLNAMMRAYWRLVRRAV
jgi:GT2 family glycosyltransferase